MIPNFLNENSGRDYPFKDDSAGNLPTSAIVDFGTVIYTQAGYSVSSDYVYLKQVRRVDNRFEFEFWSSADGLEGKALIFSRDINEEPFTTQYVSWSPASSAYDLSVLPCDSLSSFADASSSQSDCTVEGELLWEGYLVTGDLTELSELLNDCEKLDLEAEVEPETVTSFNDYHIDTLNTANDDRTRATTPDDCRDYCWDFDTGSTILDKSCLTGLFKLVAGYNCEIIQDDSNNTITIGAGIGAGKGIPCEEVKLFSGETGPSGGTLLTGGPSCGEVIRSINGVGKRIFELKAGTGTTITELPDFNKIIVNIDLSGMALCPDFNSEVPDSSSVISDDECGCGPE